MPEKQTDADKAKALQEYRAKHDAAIRRIAKLRVARLARDAAFPFSNKRNRKREAKSCTLREATLGFCRVSPNVSYVFICGEIQLLPALLAHDNRLSGRTALWKGPHRFGPSANLSSPLACQFAEQILR